MDEKQNLEFKASWHDEYLKWICGFANANGGIIYIGKNDKGEIIGVSNHKKLMEDIPNKIRNKLGIISDVNLLKDDSNYFIEIITKPYSVPVSFQGRYYFRSGSTKMEMTGNTLNEFLLKKSGKTWDDIVESTAFYNDIDENTIAKFILDANNSGRLQIPKNIEISTLLDKLRLTVDGHLKRAALVLFGKDPGKFYPNQVVKIGRFGFTASDMKFQEVIEGNLITILSDVIDILDKKFLIKPVRFEGLQRIEDREYPIAAIREMILNALIHRNYMGTSVQVKVFDDRFTIWNEGLLPEGMTVDSLKRQHSSRPRNPIIADVCFKGGYIDAWGRGTLKIIDSCTQANLPEPLLEEQDGGFIVTLKKHKFSQEFIKTLNLSDRQSKAMQYIIEKGQITNKEYQELNDVSKATASRDLKDLTTKKILENIGTKGSSSVYKLKK